jgi:hypothetical protein
MFYILFFIFLSVYKNGEILTPPVKVVLNKHLLKNYESVLNEITLKVKLQNGAVLRYIFISNTKSIFHKLYLYIQFT